MAEQFAQFVAFDLETTGLSPEKDQIIEVAGVKFTMELNKGKIVNKVISTFESFVKPTMFIPEESTKVHHITNDMVEGAPDIVSVTKDFIRFCGQSSILVAHNANFDRNFLRTVIQENKLMIPLNPIIDSLRISRQVMPESPNHKLQTLARRLRRFMNLKVDSTNLHRALYDCEVLAEVFTIIVTKRLSPKELHLASCMKNLEKIHGGAISLATPNSFEK